MTDWRDSGDSLDDVEALIFAARDYVRPSEDLRPRVLEAARTERGEQRAVSVMRYAAMIVLVLGLLAAGSRTPELLSTIGQLRQAETVIAGSELSWNLVDSFTELRRRQAQLLRSATED